jgi:membrane protease subunit HflK
LTHGSDAPPPSLAPRLAGGAVLLWLLTGIYIVPADQQAVVTRFGRVAERRVMPGIHYSLPWPVDSVWKLKVQQMQRVTIGGGAADGLLGTSDPRVAQFLTGDQNLIHMRAVAQYSTSSPADYLFRTTDPGARVAAVVESELSRRVARRGVDAVLTTEKAAIQEEVRAASQKLLDEAGVGVMLAGVSIEFAGPPPEARDAFNDVASARADSARIVNEASGYANDVLPRARGEAESMLSGAQAYRERRINEAQGDASRFTQTAAEYERASEVNGRRLYVEAMEQILPKIRKLFVDADGNVDLTILRRGEEPKTK